MYQSHAGTMGKEYSGDLRGMAMEKIGENQLDRS